MVGGLAGRWWSTEGVLQIPPLVSGGIMLGYRCTNRCRHCLYRCSPDQPDEWMSLEMAAAVFEALSREPQLEGIHIAGGEPTLRMGLVEDVVRLAVDAGVPLDYLETNGSWCRDPNRTRHQLERLRDAGLPAVLVSVSLFHNEFVPFRSTRTCVEVARRVFGPDRVVLYLPHMYTLLDRLPDDGTHRLEETCELLRIAANDPRIPASYGVIPSGRACEALRACYACSPAESFRGRTCLGQLMSTTHFHIDHHGHLFTGMCAGMVAATVEDLHAELDPDNRPVFTTLCSDGPCGVMDLAIERHGYASRGDGYVSQCDLCLDVRAHLWRTGLYPELQPPGFYAEPPVPDMTIRTDG
jgi:hypothetical protein